MKRVKWMILVGMIIAAFTFYFASYQVVLPDKESLYIFRFNKSGANAAEEIAEDGFIEVLIDELESISFRRYHPYLSFGPDMPTMPTGYLMDYWIILNWTADSRLSRYHDLINIYFVQDARGNWWVGYKTSAFSTVFHSNQGENLVALVQEYLAENT